MGYEILAIVSLIFSVISFAGMTYLWVRYLAKDLSTHSIQYVPVGTKVDEQGFEVLTDEAKKRLERDPFENII